MASNVRPASHRASNIESHRPKHSDSETKDLRDSQFDTVKEGLAYILVPKDTASLLDPKAGRVGDAPVQSVFYNPIQQFNRDLTVLAIRAFGEDYLAEKKLKSQSKPSQGKKRKRAPVNSDSGRSSAVHPEILIAETTEFDSPQTNERQEENHNIQTRDASTDASLVQASDTETLAPSTKSAQEVKSQHMHSEKPPNFSVLDALSATGLRALRYAQEIPFVTSITANDLSPAASASITANVKFNKLESKINVTTGNAMSHMYSFASQSSGVGSKKYDVIDLDPYGTAVPFLDAAMQAISDGGLLCVTCTDSGVWASCGYPEKTYALYGGTPIKGLHSHEGGLRLILHSIASTAAKYGLAIEPLMSLSIDFYARLFVRVFRSPMEVKLLAGKTMLVYNCDAGCGAWTTQLIARNKTFISKSGQVVHKHSLAQGPSALISCSHCETKTHMSGPMYAGPLHNPNFLQAILSYLPSLDKDVYSTLDRIEGMVYTALEEALLNDNSSPKSPEREDATKPERLVPRSDPSKIETHPFYFIPSALAKVIHCRAPPDAELKGALRHAGYNVSRSHSRSSSIRTNAPWTFIWKVMIEWVHQKAPIRDGALKPEMPGWRLFQTYNNNKNEKAPNVSNGGSRNESPMEGEAVGPSTEGVTSQLPRIIFDAKLGQEPERKKLLRYQHNPRANWGPMSRAKVKPKEGKDQKDS